MPNLTVAVLGPPDFAKDLGKKGTTSDITLYNLKRGTDTVTFIEPTRYPEKIAPLFFAVSTADQAIVVVDEVNAAFGETVLMLQCAGVAKGHLVLRNYLTRDQLLPLLRGTALEGYAVFERNPSGLRDLLIDEAAARGRTPGGSGEPDPGAVEMPGRDPARSGRSCVGIVPVDHFFNVKGIGTVVLGLVASGEIRTHDALQVLPQGKPVQVRSIQKHDDNADKAVKGDRVGLALKGIEADELDRGCVLSNDPGIRTTDLVSGRLELVKYWRLPLREGMGIHVGHWMQFLHGKVEMVDDRNGDGRPHVTIRLDRGLVHLPGARAILHYLEGGRLRVVGTVSLP
ncbi:MAG TPA: EF-Tu/IF-2/RF-3 family GTPase [Methanomicrobiales archaeon]|jgi:selenocysteine-specific translation elongation factor|nr:EF-Tu/IF-2/RF-3 family GTPase [Methanomicrobiales archaeon]